MRPLFWLSTIVQESQQSASRGRVLAFYRIAPCLSIDITDNKPGKIGGKNNDLLIVKPYTTYLDNR